MRYAFCLLSSVVERVAFNHVVVGSIPSGGIIFIHSIIRLKMALLQAFRSRFTHPDAIKALAGVTRRTQYVAGDATLVVLGPVGAEGSGAAERAAPAYRIAIERANKLLRFWRITKPCTFVLLPCDIPRCWPTNGQLLTATHINGGFTQRGDTKIYIFRKEEYAKVMLHEALHHTAVHVDVPPATEQWLRTRLRIHPQTTFLVNEGIVEAAATLFHAMFEAAGVGAALQASVEAQRAHAFRLAARLQAYQDRFYPLWKEDTNAYAYIVVRALCLVHVDEFVALLNRLREGRPVAADEWLAFFKSAAEGWDEQRPRVVPHVGNSLRLTV